MLLTVAVAVTGAGLGCAQGTGPMGLGGSLTSSGSTEATTSTGHGGGTPASTTTGTTNPASTTSTTSTSGGTCSGSPCKLTTPQCGCPAGQGCTLDNGAPACELLGNTAAGQACASATACEGGSLCVGGPAGGLCDTVCATDADCPSGDICAVQLADSAGNAIPGVIVCSNECDLITSSGCPTGTACQLEQETTGQQRYFTFCTSSGTGTDGASCTSAADCAPTYGCFSTMTCAQYCDPTNVNACSGQGCGELTNTTTMAPVMINGAPIGACP